MKHNTFGTYEGTSDLVEILIAESKFAFGWRPARAGLLYALRDCNLPSDTVYMTPERFAAWVDEAKLVSGARGSKMKPSEILGLSNHQIRAMAVGHRDVPATGVTSKMIALACAHYSMGLELPVPAGDARALDEWFRLRFGGTDRVVQWLGITAKTLSDRLRGYGIRGNKRYERQPEAFVIRALDWLYTVGPICPFGPKPAVDIWPGQSKEIPQ